MWREVRTAITSPVSWGEAMTTLDTLYEGLIRSPNDWELRAVLADWFEEAGQQSVADCLRWMVKHHKRPYRSTSGTYHWFNVERVTTASDPESDIPQPVYWHMSGQEGLETVFRDYADLKSADEDFYAAWQQARLGGWAPP
jgi:hypothetical protein